MRQQFTQKERDTETGLDYFGARYYSTTQGRFTTVDPLMASASTSTPQSFNRYSYVRNNPLNSIDPNGMDDCVIGKTCSFTTNDWATSGNHPEQGLIQETVTVPIPQVQPIPLETTDVSIIETVTLTSAQVASDTVIGAGKYAYNTLYGTANLVNAPIDYGLSFFTDFQFGQAELSQASTPGEQSAMYGMTIGGLMIGGYSLFGGTTSAATAANTSNAAIRFAAVCRYSGFSVMMHRHLEGRRVGLLPLSILPLCPTTERQLAYPKEIPGDLCWKEC